MTDRFIEFMTQRTDNGELICGFKDIHTDKWYYTKDSINARACVALLNQIHKENTELKEEIKKLDTFKKILEYTEKDAGERADWQAYCEKEFEGL